MLIWMCALRCEAKPVIDHYRLQKSSGDCDFDHYHNDDVSCIVSGVGADHMMAACDWAGAKYHHGHNPSWINLGTAGHKELAVGSVLLAQKISTADTPADFLPRIKFQSKLSAGEVISFPGEQKTYPDTAACDMEAHAFMQSTTRFSDVDRCHVIKVISDNRNSPAHRDKARISKLIANHMKTISQFANQLNTAAS